MNPSLRRNFFSQLVDREEFVFLHPHPRHYGRLLLHLQRSAARGCMVFQFRPCFPSFTRFWVGKWLRWVVQAVELFPVFFYNLAWDPQMPATSFKVFCLEFDFGGTDHFGFWFCFICFIDLICDWFFNKIQNQKKNIFVIFYKPLFSFVLDIILII